MPKNLHGFSLVSVMVAAVLVGFLSIALMKLLSNSRSGQQTVENSVEFSVLKSSIQHVLTNPDLCATAFVDATSTPLNYFNDTGPYPTTALQVIPKIRVGDTATSPTVAEVGKRLGGGLTITSMGFRQLANPRTVGTQFVYEVALEITATKGADAYGGRTLSNANNPFILSIFTNNSTDLIESCSASADEGCPPSMTRIQSGRGSFCIDTATRTGTDLFSSIDACAQIPTGSFGPARMCSMTEWKAACFSGLIPGMPVAGENLDPDTYAGTWGGWRRGALATCDGFTNVYTSDPIPYRCCIY